MGAYRARDLLLPPSQLSLARIPLAAAFPFVVEHPLLATAVLVIAGVSDVLDGYWARRKNMTTPTGAVVDPVTDKIFVLTVVVSLVAYARLDLWSVVLLSTREIGELPLVVWLLASKKARETRSEQPRAIPMGKLATALQFATIVFALWRLPWTTPLLGATAISGVLAAIGYWRRMLRERPAQHTRRKRNDDHPSSV